MRIQMLGLVMQERVHPSQVPLPGTLPEFREASRITVL